MGNEEEEEHREQGKGGGTGHFGRPGNEIDRKFSLGEEDVESTPPARATGVSQPQPRSRTSTA